MALYINSNEVNEFGDWRQRYIAGEMPRRVLTLPGFRNLFVAKGVVRPPGLAVTGFLQDEDHAGLFGQFDFYTLLRDSLDPIDVEIYGADFDNCDLVRFETVEDAHGFQLPGEDWVGVRQRVLFVFQQLEW